MRISDWSSDVCSSDLTRIVPKTSVVVRINAARTIFNRCVFDEERTADGLNALRRWRFKVDPDTRQYSKEPQHDEYSHGGDAFTYMAVALRSEEGRVGKECVVACRSQLCTIP